MLSSMIWLDVDDVIADFSGYMENIIGPLEPGFGWGIGGEFMRKHKVQWLELRPTLWARELLDLVRSKGGNYGYLTACIHQDRKFWLEWFDPGCTIVCTNNKGSVLKKGDIIIDDNPDLTWQAAIVRCPAKWWTTVGTTRMVMKRLSERLDECVSIQEGKS